MFYRLFYIIYFGSFYCISVIILQQCSFYHYFYAVMSSVHPETVFWLIGHAL